MFFKNQIAACFEILQQSEVFDPSTCSRRSRCGLSTCWRAFSRVSADIFAISAEFCHKAPKNAQLAFVNTLTLHATPMNQPPSEPICEGTIPAEATHAPATELAAAPSTATDRVAFTILVRQHHRQFLAYARALVRDDATSRDLTQDALVIAFKNLAKFDVTRNFPSWVRGIIRNRWREMARERKMEPLEEEMLEALEAQHAAWQYAAEVSGSGNAVFIALEDCLSKLPDPLKSAVDAFYFQEKSGAETACDLGASEASIRKRLERARSVLRQCIETKTSLTPQPA
jgi:RNA polymerase sigma-70 factor (ECF subfamily)